MGQETPGLRARKRKGGADALYWCATVEAVKAGFMPRTVNLSMHRDNPLLLSRACKRLDAEQRSWLSGKGRNRNDYDGTFSSLLQRYEKHPDSSFQKLGPSSRKTYIGYLKMLDEVIGKRRVTAVSGIDVIGWHKNWMAPDDAGWRPISTVPKDGTSVLLGRFTGDPKAMREGLVEVDWYREEGSGHSYVGFGRFNSTYWPPTHWQPIPTPPHGGTDEAV